MYTVKIFELQDFEGKCQNKTIQDEYKIYTHTYDWYSDLQLIN